MTSQEIPSDIALLAGPPLLGHLFNYGLFGILSAQVYSYYNAFPTDPVSLKAFVYGLYAVEWVQVILISHDAFQVYGAGWGDLNALTSPQWLWFDIPIMSALVSATVQCFFAWRIFILSNSRILPPFIVLPQIALMQCGAGVATGVITGPALNNNALIQEKAKNALIVWLGGSAACDIIIAVSMCFLLARQRQGLASDKLISRLITLSVETGSVTASFAALDLIFCLAFKHNNLHMLPAFMLSKLYTNSLMLVFNNRTKLRQMHDEALPTPRAGHVSQRWATSSERTRSRGGGFPSQEISLSKLSRSSPGSHELGAHRAADGFEADVELRKPRITGSTQVRAWGPGVLL
ncbi:uncharacterized protein BXZ73DRAFT_72808 [Epithele typhae]|uniref:uncharacterized protein n=1 Tax=Epithele typhae TaxID=378194 RepID=UPI0020086E8A|nr:uncharacterized protein BXZ73DRAFT_72808 [Epithele typhae]KAH9945915.1 hypothetical protein BXZ73DRAFT_72808 [Epithele typhae]